MAIGTNYKELINTDSNETQLIKGLDVIKMELEVLLGFERYTLFFGNNMGLDANRFLQLRNPLATFNLIKAEIEKLIVKYNRVRLVKTEMIFKEDTSTLEINLTVIPKGARESLDVQITLGN